MDKRLKESVLTQLGYGIDTIDDAQKTYAAIARLWDEGDPRPRGFATETQTGQYYKRNSDAIWGHISAQSSANNMYPLEWISTRAEAADIMNNETFQTALSLITLRDATSEMLVDGLVGAQQ